jgi:hypothetical protein
VSCLSQSTRFWKGRGDVRLTRARLQRTTERKILLNAVGYELYSDDGREKLLEWRALMGWQLGEKFWGEES